MAETASYKKIVAVTEFTLNRCPPALQAGQMMTPDKGPCRGGMSTGQPNTNSREGQKLIRSSSRLFRDQGRRGSPKLLRRPPYDGQMMTPDEIFVGA